GTTTMAMDTCHPAITASNNGPITCANPTRTVSSSASVCPSETVSYLWSNSNSGASFTTSNANTYSVTITQNGNGCSATASTTLTVDTCKPSVTASNDGPITCSNPTRTVNASAISCLGETLNYLWSNGETGSSFNTDSSNTYSVTVTQTVNGCTASASTTLSIDTCSPTLTVTNDGPITCANPTSNLTATGNPCSGETVSYLWNTQSTSSIVNTGNAGSYFVVVTHNGNGCTVSGSTILAVDTCQPTVATSASGFITCDISTVTISASALPCSGSSVSFLWPDNSTGGTYTTTTGGSYCVAVTDAGNGCSATACEIVAVDTTAPSCQINGTYSVSCGSTGNSITATVNTQPGATFNWSVLSGSGYIVVSGNSPTLVYDAGSGQGTFLLEILNPNGCSSSCTVDVSALCDRFCTYTMGYYGNSNGTACNGLRASTFMRTLIGANPIVIGGQNAAGQFNRLTIDSASVNCMITRMPSSGPSVRLNGDATCQTPSGIALNSNGKFANTLLGQTIALSFNLRINGGALATQRITGVYMITAASNVNGCGTNGTPVPGTEQYYQIPQSVLTQLGSNNTVGDLLQLANNALAGSYLPSPGAPSLSEINAALDAINRGFDECRVLVSFTNTSPVQARTNASNSGNRSYQLEADGMVSKAYPNPFSSSTIIEFSISDFNDKVSVEVRGLDGQLVSRLYEGPVNGGEVVKVEFDAADMPSGVYFYRIISGDLMQYGKLLLQR
ncbi:MAG: T9SS type A sorting domain-containing protein, partial [Bacteroidota bacterium]